MKGYFFPPASAGAMASVVDDAHRGAVVALGNFDGLHRGHQALFERARRLARSLSPVAPVGVVTFEPHPVRVLAPHLAPPLILRPDEKEAGLRALDVDVYFVIGFDSAIAALSADAFIEQVLHKQLGVAGVVVGEDFRFGNKARGTVADLQRHFGERAVAVAAVREGELVCSSSKVRELVMQGNIEAAALLLGHPYFVEGSVVRGDGRGRTIGIPTANIESKRELLPRVGVYATRAVLDDGRVLPSVTNVGLRPTFDGQGVRIEAHVFDLDEDLYGRRLRVDFIQRLRDEQRFSGIEALVAQIKVDIGNARAVLA